MSRIHDICDVLIDAVVGGASEVIRVRRSEELGVSAKDTTELVTAADQASDTAIRKIFESRLAAIDPDISFILEESGGSAVPAPKEAGADPLDGTNHFVCGGCSYSVQAYYSEDAIPVAGVVFQPEVFLALGEEDGCQGRLVWAVRGEGAFMRRSRLSENGFQFGAQRVVKKKDDPRTPRYVACVPLSARMVSDEREQVRRVQESGLISVTTGVGGAGGNVMLTIFGGQQVYANFGAGLDLDLIPPQVIAEEAGLTVWGTDRRSPIWRTRRQPVVVAPNPDIADLFLRAAGF